MRRLERGSTPNGKPLAARLAESVRAGQVRADATVDAAIHAAESASCRTLGAFVARHLDASAALSATERVGGEAAGKRRASRGRDGGTLAGVPFAASDDLADVALPTTAGSRLLERYVSPYEATAIARLHDAGAVLLGKTNVDEFGLGTTTERSAYGPTRHPAAAEHLAGGASGGAAAAVAAGVVSFALGADASGDVRVPASHCGVVGIRATYGRVSRSGVVGHPASLVQVGVFGRRVDDAALALEVISGRDPRDPSSADLAADMRADGGPVDDGRPLRGVRVGRLKDVIDAADGDVAARTESALVSMRDLGATVTDVALDDIALVGPTHRVIAAAERASALAGIDGVRFGPRATAAGVRRLIERTRGDKLGPAIFRDVLLGTHLASETDPNGVLNRAQAARARVSRALVDLFSDVDLLVAPVALQTAPRASAQEPDDAAEVDAARALILAVNLAGLPAASVPVGAANGLPIGVHLIGRHFAEGLLVRAAAAVEHLLFAEATA